MTTDGEASAVVIPPLALERLRQLAAASARAQQACQEAAELTAMALGLDPQTQRLQVDVEQGIITVLEDACLPADEPPAAAEQAA